MVAPFKAHPDRTLPTSSNHGRVVSQQLNVTKSCSPFDFSNEHSSSRCSRTKVCAETIKLPTHLQPSMMLATVDDGDYL